MFAYVPHAESLSYIVPPGCLSDLSLRSVKNHFVGFFMLDMLALVLYVPVNNCSVMSGRAFVCYRDEPVLTSG